jgi:xanthine dehydrogenase iron-sulfur cluster and FAD-binding subunit A
MCQDSRPQPMTNSHLLQHEFDYIQPSSLDEALSLLAEYGDSARLLAGGTYLLVQMKQEQVSPDVVVNIGDLSALSGASWSEEGYHIGALTKIRETRELPSVRDHYQVLAEACASFGSMQIQMMGTLGGNVCNGSPASDAVPALTALDASVVLAGAGGMRSLPLSAFLLGPGETDLRPGEIVTQVLLPRPPDGAGSAFIKISRVAADLAKVSGAAVLVREGDRILDCRLAFGSVAPTVIRAERAEAFLRGRGFSPELALAAGEIAMSEVSPIDDVRSSAWYRREVCKTVTHDLLIAAWDRAAEARPAPHVASAGHQQLVADHRGTRHLQAGQKAQIVLRVNGEHHRVRVAANDLLLNVLRENLELTGSKYGCGIGECGACTVLLDGRPTLACLTLAAAVDGADIVTVEGLRAADGSLHPLQESFLDHQAFQCGYCTPGILIMSKALLDDLPTPDEEDVREYLRGNRCRCTGFMSITRAVLACAEQADGSV